MSANKTVVIVLCSFLAAGILCLAVGLGVYFTAIDLPASADDRGARVLAGIIILAVGGLNSLISLAAACVYRHKARTYKEQRIISTYDKF